MDPLTAIGIASNILSFIDFSAKLIAGAHDVYNSASGTTEEAVDAAHIINDFESLSRRLGFPQSSARIGAAATDDDKALAMLVHNCRTLSDELLRALRRLQAKNKGSKGESLLIAWRAMRQKGQLESLEKRVEKYRRQILDRITIMMRYSVYRCFLATPNPH
jgi:hypothetical protein